MDIYLVGGAVRDKLLGLPVAERDWVVVGATPEQMAALGYRPVGKDFPVFLHPDTQEEYALARTERKTAPGYKGFVVHADPDVTLAEDLLRRDLTINAIAEAADGTLIDPYHGQDDLRDGLLKHVSPAFVEDPVRILRVARFAARFARWGFRVAHGTHALMQRMVEDGEVDALVPERVWQECERALGEDQPARFFQVLKHCGALARVMPELDALFPERASHTPQPTQQTMSAVQALEHAAATGAERPLRFAVLTHTLADDTTDDDALAALCDRLKVPNEYRELARALGRLYRLAQTSDLVAAEPTLRCIEAVDAFRRPERYAQLLDCCAILGLPDAKITRLRDGFARCNTLRADALVAAGVRGAEVGRQLRAQRLAALEATQQQQ